MPSALLAGGRTARASLLLACLIFLNVDAVQPERDTIAQLDAWAEHHDDVSRPAILLRPKYGLGNRMLSAISALAFAVATDRRLFIEWDQPFEGLFDSPFPSGWRRPVTELAYAPSATAGSRAQILDLTASSPSFSNIAAKMACHGAQAVLGDAAVVEVEYIILLLYSRCIMSKVYIQVYYVVHNTRNMS